MIKILADTSCDLSDEMKEKYLQSLGLHILRFRNDEIFNNMADVTSKIEHCIKIH